MPKTGSLDNSDSLKNSQIPIDPSPSIKISPERKQDKHSPERKPAMRRLTRTSTYAPRLTYGHESKATKHLTDVSIVLQSYVETADVLTLETDPDSTVLLAS